MLAYHSEKYENKRCCQNKCDNDACCGLLHIGSPVALTRTPVTFGLIETLLLLSPAHMAYVMEPQGNKRIMCSTPYSLNGLSGIRTIKQRLVLLRGIQRCLPLYKKGYKAIFIDCVPLETTYALTYSQSHADSPTNPFVL